MIDSTRLYRSAWAGVFDVLVAHPGQSVGIGISPSSQAPYTSQDGITFPWACHSALVFRHRSLAIFRRIFQYTHTLEDLGVGATSDSTSSIPPAQINRLWFLDTVIHLKIPPHATTHCTLPGGLDLIRTSYRPIKRALGLVASRQLFVSVVANSVSMPRTTLEWIVIAIASLQANGHGPTLKVQVVKDSIFEEAKASNRRFAPRRPVNEVVTEALFRLFLADLVVIPGVRELDNPEAEVTLTKDLWDQLPSTNAPTLDQLVTISGRKGSRRSAAVGTARQSVKRAQIHEAQIKRFNDLVVFVDLEAEYSANDDSVDRRAQSMTDARAQLAQKLEEFKEIIHMNQVLKAAATVQTESVRGLIYGLTRQLGDYVLGFLGLSEDHTKLIRAIERYIAQLDDGVESLMAKEAMRKVYIKAMQALMCEVFGPGNHLLLMQKNEDYAKLIDRD
ncbi:hypothetical protein DFP72DRAFT_1084556 [Ephemerocybe angulata]|uniref:Uncharacterized protein n=1 Tax=Ephemerocybe angulata TaxID=980116 RepID=A0A8H6LRP5_9AGAR|nr:hypothetical protein DFP72DRAFT_1084556 [Tulosesus angulatus]